MQALPEHIHDTEIMVDHLLEEVMPRLEHFRQCVADNRAETLKTRQGKIVLQPNDLRKGLLEKWIPAARKRMDLANDAYYDIKHKASGRVVSLLQGQVGTRSINRINLNLTDIRDRLENLEDSLETHTAVSRITDISPNFSGPMTREIDILKARIEKLENRQQTHESTVNRELKMQKVFNMNFDRRIGRLREKQAALDPKLRYLDGRTIERSQEMRQLQDQMTRFDASLKLVKEEQQRHEPTASIIPLRQVATIAGVLTMVGLSGVIVYQSVTGESPIFGNKDTAVASDQGEREQTVSASGVKYLPR